MPRSSVQAATVLLGRLRDQAEAMERSAIRVAALGAQSPSLAIALWQTVRANNAKATAFWGQCARVAPFKFLGLTT